jgi:uncharacterized protein (DUF1800 family)
MVQSDAAVRHLFRRAGFGLSPQELELFRELSHHDLVQRLTRFEESADPIREPSPTRDQDGDPIRPRRGGHQYGVERIPDDVDRLIGTSGYVLTTSSAPFAPNTSINDARQRWLFRMVHSQRPLQEKMTLFWHNHFATAYSKVAGSYSSSDAARMMAAKSSEDPAGQEGQLELIRRRCLGNFRDLVIALARDPAMLVWLDGRFNVKAKPQENFGRELMELFSMGVQFYTEADVYAAARVFTGWNLSRTTTGASDPSPAYAFRYNASEHEPTAKTFSFPIYSDGSKTIPARTAADGEQDGIDLITAAVSHPETARRLARRLYNFFVNELQEPDARFIDDLADTYLRSGYNVRLVMQRLLGSPQFLDPANYYARYSWPVEFVVRALKEIGWTGFSVATALTPLSGMGQILYEPPDVSGWDLGPDWISSGAMLARMNFAATLTSSQRIPLADAAKPYGQTPDSVLSYVLDRLSPAPYDDRPLQELRTYLLTGGAWTGSDTQLRTKVPGLAHLIAGSGEYVFV